MLVKLDNQEELIKYKWRLYFKASDMNEFDFRDFKTVKELFRAIYYRNLSIEDAETNQITFEGTLNVLERYNPKKPDYKTAKDNLLLNARNLYEGRGVIINAFKDKIFPFGVEEPEDLGKRPDDDESDDESYDETDNEFYTPRELETIPELSNFENEEETPKDVPDLETEESAEQRRNRKRKRIKSINSTTNA